MKIKILGNIHGLSYNFWQVKCNFVFRGKGVNLLWHLMSHIM